MQVFTLLTYPVHTEECQDTSFVEIVYILIHIPNFKTLEYRSELTDWACLPRGVALFIFYHHANYPWKRSSAVPKPTHSADKREFTVQQVATGVWFNSHTVQRALALEERICTHSSRERKSYDWDKQENIGKHSSG